MADPRNTVDFEGIGDRVTATFIADNSTITYATETARSAVVGLAVNLSASKTVQLAGDGEAVLGAIEKVEEDGKVTVHMAPVVTFIGGASATLTPGSRIVGDLGGGGGTGKGYIQTMGATTGASLVGRGMILDAADTGSVKVAL